MSRESLDAFENPPLVDGREGEDVATRLVAVEHAYHELLGRLERYERERAEIQERLERVLGHLASIKGR